MMPRGNLKRFARLSIGAAIATIALMLAAYHVTDSVGLLADALESLVNLAAVIFWAGVSLHMVGVLGDLSAAAAGFLQLRWKVGATEISIEGLAIFFTVLVSTILLSRLLRFILSAEIFPRIELPGGVPGGVNLLSAMGYYCSRRGLMPTLDRTIRPNGDSRNEKSDEQKGPSHYGLK